MIPNIELAVVEEKKILDYLLSPEHSEGRSKAVFFQSIGFNREQWTVLRASLILHAVNNAATETTSAYGVKYVVDGQLESPSGAVAYVRAVWIVELDGVPRLVTAHPLPRQKHD